MDAAFYPVIATITAAFIAGLVAFLTSMLSKELKTSEFRYSWLNAVLDDTAKFLGAAESALKQKDGPVSEAQPEEQLGEAMAAYYRARIRLYPEKHASVIAAAEGLQRLVVQGRPVDRTVLDSTLSEVVATTHEALKAEWSKVKRGETVFRVTKYVSLLAVAASLALPLVLYFWTR